ncbi:WAT1-related protein [Striga hermonthica]|uniref:WAT1-related protein n=1 Tax=Striga hermonthica TaxID=68872 RepID=A0A9N7RAM6_STRHE|nr:WAT1-related protein [Striga hermonthica]
MGLENYKPIIVMVGCQFVYAGVTLFGRAGILQGMSTRVFVVYRQCLAFLIMSPIAYISSITLNQNLYYEGLALANSTVGSTLGNLMPAITFVMAYTLGLEKVNIRRLRSVVKIIGTVVCVCGAATMALFKGPKLLLSVNNGHDTWFLGCLFLLASPCCWSVWLILQAHVSARYPDHLLVTTLMFLMAALQSAVVALILEPDMSAWIFNSPMPWISVFYAGGASAVTFFAQAWCLPRRGPLFSAMFHPLTTVIVAIVACTFLHEMLYVGSLLGGVAVITGLYIVLWGKAKDYEDARNEKTIGQIDKENDETTPSTQTSEGTIDLEAPLLLRAGSSIISI